MSLVIPDIPPKLKKMFSTGLLKQILALRGLDANELSLFEWFEREQEILIEKMLQQANAEIQKQIDARCEDINDSGMVAVAYFVKRSRYSHVIFITSLLETYLDEACQDLTRALGEQNILFQLEELSGDKWSKRKKYLERYGNFQISEDIWSHLSALTSIRNFLVHENGNCAGLGEKQRQKLCRIPGINFDGCEIVIEPALVSSALFSLRELVEAVDTELKGVLGRAIQFQRSPENR
jgi:hypothetical protein